MTEQLLKMKKNVQPSLDKARYDHSIGVMHPCACLAMRYGADMDAALTAGLLHDCAKGLSSEEKLRLCKKYHLEVSEAERANPGLLHAKLGAFFAWQKYHVKDKAILRAIACHTTGKPNMSLLDKILYVADFIEPGRCEAPNLPEVRALAFVNLDECLFRILQDTLLYLERKKAALDPVTEKTYQYYKERREERYERTGTVPPDGKNSL